MYKNIEATFSSRSIKIDKITTKIIKIWLFLEIIRGILSSHVGA